MMTKFKILVEIEAEGEFCGVCYFSDCIDPSYCLAFNKYRKSTQDQTEYSRLEECKKAEIQNE